MAYSYPLYQRIDSFLKSDDWHYEFDDEKELFRIPKVGLGKDKMFPSCNLILDIREDRYIVYATIGMNCRQESLPEMYTLLHLINYGTIFGNYEIDARDGEIRYKMTVDCDGCLPSEAVIKDSLYIPCQMIQKYGNAIGAVMFGMKDAQTAYDEAYNS